MTALTIDTTLTLNDGVEIPRLGFGTFQVADGAECERAVHAAIETGYRHIDTAAVYRNESSVGRAVADSGLPRKDMFITTKCWIDDFGRDETRRACENSLRRLGTEYIDLYLLHWPVDETLMPAWEACIGLKEQGKCRSIGVSNFMVKRFTDFFFRHTDVTPSVNQVEIHPFGRRPELVQYCEGKGIWIESYAPLARANRLQDPVLTQIAAAHGKTVAQVMIRWHLQKDFVVIPKSSHPERIRENTDVYDFRLSADEISRIDALDEGLSTIQWRPPNWY